MAIQSGVGISHHRNPQVAGKEAVEKALASGMIEKADFIFAFATVGYNQEQVIAAIRKATDNTPLTGCSAEGVIVGGEVDESNFSVAVMVIKSDTIRFSHGIEVGLKEDPNGVGEKIAQGLSKHAADDALALFLFPDGLTINYDALKSGITENINLNTPLPFFGGAAGDNWKFEKTYQYCDDTVTSDGVAWSLMSGTAKILSGVGHGCIPLGIEHKVTKATGNTVYEIDGKPVLDILKNDYLTTQDINDWTKTFQTFTLGLRAPQKMADYDQYIIRTMVGGINMENGAVTLATEVKEGESMWVARRDFDKMANDNRKTLKHILNNRSETPFSMVFQFECIGRGKVFVPDKIKQELITILREEVGLEVPWIGFYTYGEIGPVGEDNHFHNESMVLMTIQE
ncbi:MAG: FIST C-terminal domain-containing protein [Nitrospinae bacterium]|nr:FIST C-terminal domain-containing protein [Nitrospinota bacterium]